MIYMSAGCGGVLLDRRAKTVKSLSSILSALSSVLSDPTVFLTGGSLTARANTDPEIQRNASRESFEYFVE